MKVLIVGDPPGSPGGIAQVMNQVSAWCSADPSIDIRFLDPLGKATSTRPNTADLVRTILGMCITRPDLVHFNTASRGSTYRNILLAQIARALRLPYVIHLHGGGYPKFISSVSNRTLTFVKSYFGGAERVIALTPSWKTFVVETLGVSESAVCVVPNGTATPSRALLSQTVKTNRPTFVYVGRLTGPKGVPELLEAFNKLPISTGAQLILIGGSKDQSVEAAPPELFKNVTELGWCPNSEALRVMSRAWAVILPSHFENMPLTILEAMSVSTAVIATDVGGIPEIVRRNVDGLLLSAGDVNGLTQAIYELCDPSRSLAYGKNGRARWLENYTSDLMCESLMTVWRNASR